MELTENTRYHFVYRRFNGRVNDECVALFLGYSHGGDLLISLRPKAGSSAITRDQLQSAEPTTAPVMLPRRHRVAA